jgi:hypothetical protein
MMQREILNRSCTTGPCHNPQSVAGGLILTEGFSYDNLVGAMAHNAAAQQEGLDRVTPFDLDGSFLLQKLEGPRPGFGSRMPLGAEPLSESEMQIVRNWIADGAPGPETPTAGASPSATPTATLVPESPTATAVPATATPTDVPATPTATASNGATAMPTTPVPPTATPTTAAPTDTPAVTLQQVQDEIFTPSCAVQFCHSGGFPSSGLSLEDGLSFDQLVGVTPTNPAAASDGLLRVDPGAPDNSFLMTKIIGPTRIELGSKMPLTGPALTDQQIALVRAWIASL